MSPSHSGIQAAHPSSLCPPLTLSEGSEDGVVLPKTCPGRPEMEAKAMATQVILSGGDPIYKVGIPQALS